jgi:ABC-type uncharacterized transport system substrate-binding protein
MPLQLLSALAPKPNHIDGWACSWTTECASPFASKRRISAMFAEREFAEAGGLMVYGPYMAANSHRAGMVVQKILKGPMPADFPVKQPQVRSAHQSEAANQTR